MRTLEEIIDAAVMSSPHERGALVREAHALGVREGAETMREKAENEASDAIYRWACTPGTNVGKAVVDAIRSLPLPSAPSPESGTSRCDGECGSADECTCPDARFVLAAAPVATTGEKCPECGGRGWFSGTNHSASDVAFGCPDCGGTGKAGGGR